MFVHFSLLVLFKIVLVGKRRLCVLVLFLTYNHLFFIFHLSLSVGILYSLWFFFGIVTSFGHYRMCLESKGISQMGQWLLLLFLFQSCACRPCTPHCTSCIYASDSWNSMCYDMVGFLSFWQKNNNNKKNFPVRDIFPLRNYG